MVLFLQHQQRSRLRQCLLFTIQFPLKLSIGMLQFADFLGMLTPTHGSTDDAERRAPLLEMVDKSTPLTAPGVQALAQQAVTLMQSQQSLFQ